MPLLPSRLGFPSDIPNLRKDDDYWFYNEVEDDSADQQRCLRASLRPEDEASFKKRSERYAKITAFRNFERGEHQPSDEVLDRELAGIREKAAEYFREAFQAQAGSVVLQSSAYPTLLQQRAAALKADMEEAAFGANPPANAASTGSEWTDAIPLPEGGIGADFLPAFPDYLLGGMVDGKATLIRIRKGATIRRTAKGAMPEVPIWASEARVIFRGSPASGPEASQFWCAISSERTVPKFIGYSWSIHNTASDIIAVEFRA